MKRILITFGTNEYNKSINLLGDTALKIGKVDDFQAYDSTVYDEEFKRKYRYILSKSRGAGCWCWKPYIIMHQFLQLDEGDIVLYSDAGLKVIADLNPLFDVVKKNINGGKVIFKLSAHMVKAHLAKTWIKRDCFVLMNCDTSIYWDANMTNGALSLWMKTEENIRFLNEWLQIMKDSRVITDDPNMCGVNFLDFKAHRHDQAILTLLSKKYNFELFRDPTQYGEIEKKEFSNSTYNQLFYHHRNFIH